MSADWDKMASEAIHALVPRWSLMDTHDPALASAQRRALAIANRASEGARQPGAFPGFEPLAWAYAMAAAYGTPFRRAHATPGQGCRKIDGTWIHFRPHICPTWARR